MNQIPPSGVGGPAMQPEQPDVGGPAKKRPFDEKKEFFEKELQKQTRGPHVVGGRSIFSQSNETPPQASPASKEKIEEMGRLPEAQEAKKKFSWNPLVWLSKIFSWFQGLFYSNRKENVQAEDIKQMKVKSPEEQKANLIADELKKKVELSEAQKVRQAEVKAQSQILRRIAKEFEDNPGLLDIEGMFRIPANADKIMEAKTRLMMSPNGALPTDPHELAGLFKLIFGNLNLFGSTNKKLNDTFYQTAQTLFQEKDQTKIIQGLQALIDGLSSERKADLKAYLNVLVNANQHEKNKMVIQALAIVAAPNMDTSEDTLAQQAKYVLAVNRLGVLFLQNFGNLKFERAGQEKPIK